MHFLPVISRLWSLLSARVRGLSAKMSIIICPSGLVFRLSLIATIVSCRKYKKKYELFMKKKRCTVRGDNSMKIALPPILKGIYSKRKEFAPKESRQFTKIASASCTLWKHAYSKILKISPPKNENFRIKKSYMFLISAQNIDCRYSLEQPRWGAPNEYPQSMFWAEIRKIMYTPLYPSFYYIKMGFKVVKIL